MIELIGVLIGKVLKSFSAEEFVKSGFTEMIEKYDSPKFRRGFISGYNGLFSLRLITDGSDRKKQADEILNAIKDIDIDYPNTFEILKEIADAYISESNVDYLYSEFGEL